MTTYFFDSSALVKRYIRETGTAWVHGVISASVRHSLYISQITPVEIMSSVNRRHREKIISARDVQAARILLDRHIARQYDVIYLTVSVETLAKDLLRRHPLRAADAIQLACALIANRRLVKGGVNALIFVVSDIRLHDAAVGEGLTAQIPA